MKKFLILIGSFLIWFAANAAQRADTIDDGLHTFDTLRVTDAAPLDTTVAVNVVSKVRNTWSVDITRIDTTVSMQFQGSLDGVSWFNLDAGDTNIVFRTNGTFAVRTTTHMKFTRALTTGETGVDSTVLILPKFRAEKR